MTQHDSRGLAVSTTSAAALAHYERAVDLALGYYADPVAAVDAALAEDPDFVMAHVLRGTLHALANERGAVPAVSQAIEAAKPLLADADERARTHVCALSAWRDGDWTRAVRRWGDILADHPRDVVALLGAHIGDFFLGWSQMLRDHPARVLPHWDESVPGFNFVLGMHAFGLEECGEYARAEEVGLRALDLQRRDPWAVHAVAHVMEMQGRPDDGRAFLAERRGDWEPEGLFAFHLHWHGALYALENGDTAAALAVYDSLVRPKPNSIALELIDATAMLWRLRLRGVELGARWDEVADHWERLADDGHYAFNDVHAMMAFVGAGRPRSQRRVLYALAETALRGGANAAMSREVGLPLCRALDATGRGAWGEAVDLLLDVRPIAQRFGGSHAQRDVIALTLHHAALRAGRPRIAASVAAERLAARPDSPFARLLSRTATGAAALAA